VGVMSIPKSVDCAVTDVAFDFLYCKRLLMRCDVTARVISMPNFVRVDVMDGHPRVCFLVPFL